MTNGTLADTQSSDSDKFRYVITLLDEAERVTRGCASPQGDMLAYLLWMAQVEARAVAGDNVAW